VLQVGIKRVEGGAFSTWANEDLKPGDTLEAMPPDGRFHTPLDARGAALSGLRRRLGHHPGAVDPAHRAGPRAGVARFTLVYANRGVTTIMFREELEDLKNTYLGRLNVIHVLETDAPGDRPLHRAVTEEKCADLFRHWIDIAKRRHRLHLRARADDAGHRRGAARPRADRRARSSSSFSPAAQPGRLKRKAVSTRAARTSANTASAAITLDGATQTIEMPKDSSILDAALANALDAPFACKAGVCSTCRCRVLEGEVEMVANHALEDYEVSRGYVLTCQCLPVSDRLVVDYDQ
jgi:ring-1,2-phenylacetyl-CoA epoxidase subunit PaaE